MSLVDPLLARAEGVAEHGDAPHQDEDQAHPVEHAELRKHESVNLCESFSLHVRNVQGGPSAETVGLG